MSHKNSPVDPAVNFGTNSELSTFACHASHLFWNHVCIWLELASAVESELES